MNKKFLKGVAALFAVAVLGVSCQSNSKPGDDDKNGTKPTAITEAEVNAFLQQIGTVTASTGSVTFVFTSVNISSGIFEATSTVAADAKKSEALSDLKTKLIALTKKGDSKVNLVKTEEQINQISAFDNTADLNGVKTDSALLSIQLKSTDTSKYSLPNTLKTITIKLTPKSGQKFENS